MWIPSSSRRLRRNQLGTTKSADARRDGISERSLIREIRSNESLPVTYRSREKTRKTSRSVSQQSAHVSLISRLARLRARHSKILFFILQNALNMAKIALSFLSIFNVQQANVYERNVDLIRERGFSWLKFLSRYTIRRRGIIALMRSLKFTGEISLADAEIWRARNSPLWNSVRRFAGAPAV